MNYKKCIVLFTSIFVLFSCKLSEDKEMETAETVSDETIAELDSLRNAVLNQPAVPPETSGDVVIDSIRAQYQKIQSSPLTQRKVAYIPQEDSEARAVGLSGLVTWYLAGNEVVKVVDTGAEDHGQWQQEFYYKNGNLFFLFVKMASGGAGEEFWIPNEHRFYLQNGKVYKYIHTGNNELDGIYLERLLKKGNAYSAILTKEEILKYY